ncbi:hypothetical protein M2315_001517 [Agrobacterium fabrum]|nr:hypothetical protein [Agrobacterium fabrum]
MIGVTLGIRPQNIGVTGFSASALSPLRALLTAGRNAKIFVNADSTAHAQAGPFQQFAAMLGDLHDATVVLYRWAEWETNTATGPKAYADSVTPRTGKRATLTPYLATLPGGMAGYMAIAAITRMSGGRRSPAVSRSCSSTLWAWIYRAI